MLQITNQWLYKKNYITVGWNEKKTKDTLVELED